MVASAPCFFACPGGMQPLSFFARPGGQSGRLPIVDVSDELPVLPVVEPLVDPVVVPLVPGR